MHTYVHEFTHGHGHGCIAVHTRTHELAYKTKESTKKSTQVLLKRHLKPPDQHALHTDRAVKL